MTVETLLEEIRTLSSQDRQRLIHALLVEQTSIDTSHKRSILEFGAIGADIASGIDAQEYVNQLRDEWDDSR